MFIETWLTDINKDQLPFQNVQQFHLIRQNVLRASGGVSIFVKNDLQAAKPKIVVPDHL